MRSPSFIRTTNGLASSSLSLGVEDLSDPELVEGESNGFTLVELLVVIAIIGIIVGLILPQLGNFNRYQSLENAKNEIITAFREAQSNAQGGVVCGAPDNNQKVNSWKLEFINATQYKIYPDCIYSINPTPTPNAVLYQLPAGVSLVSYQPTCASQISCPIITPSPYPQIIFKNLSSVPTISQSCFLCSGQNQVLNITLKSAASTIIVTIPAVIMVPPTPTP